MIAQRLCRDCEATAHRFRYGTECIQNDCAVISQQFRSDFTAIVRILRNDCAAIANYLRSDCAMIAAQ
jgi:hypothetical protein